MRFLTCFIFLLLLISVHVKALEVQTCENLLLSELSAQDLDQAIKSISRLQIEFDLAQAQGDHSVHLQTVASDLARLKREIVNRGMLSAKALNVEIRKSIVRLQKQRTREIYRRREEKEKQTRATELTVIDGAQLIFQKVMPGKYIKGDRLQETGEVEITRAFDMAATMTTQAVWWKIASTARQQFPEKYDFNDLHEHQPTPGEELYPITHVSFDDTKRWFRALNELSLIGHPIVKEIIPDFQPGDVYRLPTDAEWEFVLRARGEASGLFFFGDDVSELGRYAWYQGNSGMRVHPVALKEPLIFDGLRFYDMLGNASEWVADAYESKLNVGKDPFNEGKYNSNRVTRGGVKSPDSMYSGRFNLEFRGPGAFSRDSGHGFRVVRVRRR